eukprot:scaffold13751_cov108-Isochrysis_galbana.AAC.3
MGKGRESDRAASTGCLSRRRHLASRLGICVRVCKQLSSCGTQCLQSLRFATGLAWFLGFSEETSGRAWAWICGYGRMGAVSAEPPASSTPEPKPSMKSV